MKLRFWENWNTRTKSTVQYVGVSEWHEAGRSGVPREEEEDDEDADDGGSIVESSTGKHTHRSPMNAMDRSAGTGEGGGGGGGEEERDGVGATLGMEKERGGEGSGPREAMEEEMWRWNERLRGDRTASMADWVRYKEYSEFRERLKESAVEREESDECGGWRRGAK